MDASYKILGNRIKELLEKRGINQNELAERAGITPVTLSRYIRGTRVPKWPVLASIARELHVSAEYLMGLETRRSSTDSDFALVLEKVTGNAGEWTCEQKTALILALFNGGEKK